MSLRTSAAYRVLDGFGGSVRSLSRSVRPTSVSELAAVFAAARAEGMQVSFRGSGRSYGDASLNSGQLAIDNRGMSRILSFDRATGVIDAEGGASIADLWRHALPQGWWPTVVPGTMHPTMGGCVGMNIHGKNCFKVGPFGDSLLELDLLTANGELKTLSRTQEPELFRAVIGGLGLLGAVTRVKLQMKHLESGELKVRPLVSKSLAHMFEQFEEHLPTSDYVVGWVDCFASGAALGRGLVHKANYLSAAEDPGGAAKLTLADQDLPGSIAGMPKSLLWIPMSFFMNDTGAKFVNAVKYALPEPTGKDGTYRDSHAGFAFLLDYVPDWRLAYGPGGFIQVQLFVPDASARDAFAEALKLCQRRGVVSYLGVFKRHKADDYLLSHGLDGWSLALDFKVPRDAQRLRDTAADLTKLVLDAGGKYYPAKDQVVDAGSFAQSLGGNLTRFGDLRRTLDPGGLFANDQARRLGLV
ncbi:MAG: FAD-binding oxidoreductase [Candidatus Eisenbacteria bacterium]